MLSNVVTFRVITRSQLSVGIARDDRSMFFVTVIFDAFVHFLDVNVRVPRVGGSKHWRIQSFVDGI